MSRSDEADTRIKPELLAPAGDRTCLIAAVENGADAVYFGLQRHNARIRANNFDGADLPEVMALLHRRGVKGYITLNTLAFPDELADLEETVRELAAAGVDAVIVQDLGLARLIRRDHARSRDPRVHPDVDHQRGRGRAGARAGLHARDPGPRAGADRDRPHPSRDRFSRRGLRARCALRGLFGTMPDQRGTRRSVGESGRMCPGVPHAL